METKVNIAILGAGVAGLAAALKAHELGLKDTVIYEAANSAGGLLGGFLVDNFYFDNAVHLSFATENKVREIFDKTPYLTHPSDSLNFESGKWLKHPVQNNLFPLDVKEKVELIESFLNRPEHEQPTNYEEWLRYQYGNAIAERYPIKYTKKYWQCAPKELSTTWIGNRMRRASLNEILYGALSSKTPNTYYTKEMRYPKHGGYQAFIQPLIDESNIQLNHKVTQVNLKDKQITFANGNIVHYTSLVNTLPLPVIINLCGDDVPLEIRKAVYHLEATSVDLISVGFNKEVTKDLWFYIYDEDILPSRAYSPSVKSPANVPVGCSSLQFEIYNPKQISQHCPEELKKNILYGLKKMKIANETDILFLHHKHLPWANITYKLGMETHRKAVITFLEKEGITNAGRFGEWAYLWSNQSFMSGYKAIEAFDS